MKALILVDLQNDFAPGGALAVPEGDQVIPVANRVQERFDLIVSTQDWHPRNHGSFASNHPGKKVGEVIMLDGLPQVLWPVHCVQQTRGADFIPGLITRKVERVFRKGIDPKIDSYSGFYDNGQKRSTGLDDFLKQRGVVQVYVMGLATDYCVKFTALDSRRLGFDTFVIEDGCRGVNLKPGDSGVALGEMKNANVSIVRSSMV